MRMIGFKVYYDHISKFRGSKTFSTYTKSTPIYYFLLYSRK
jgi:hypothetical protein